MKQLMHFLHYFFYRFLLYIYLGIQNIHGVKNITTKIQEQQYRSTVTITKE